MKNQNTLTVTREDEHQSDRWPEAPSPAESWLMSGEAGPAYLVSIATYGADGPEAAGSMSPNWGQPGRLELNKRPAEMKQLTDEQRAEIVKLRATESRLKMNKFLDVHRLNRADLVVIKPQGERSSGVIDIVCADNLPRPSDSYLEDSTPASMMYTRDPERVLAIRPADCPTLIGYGLDEESQPLLFLLHSGWQDEEAGFVEQGLSFVRDELGVDPAIMNFIIAPGGIDFDYKRPTDPATGQDERFQHSAWADHLKNVQQDEDGNYRFIIDMPGFLTSRLHEFGVTDHQIFFDDSDTSRLDSGYSSHKRWANKDVQTPMRDVVVAMMPQYAEKTSERGRRFRTLEKKLLQLEV